MTEPTMTGLTPSQTAGPFLAIGLAWADGPTVVPGDTVGAIRVHGRVFDGQGEPVPDAVVETWQADPTGHFGHPDDPHGTVGFRGFGRCLTDDAGGYAITTVKPGVVAAADGRPQAPHLDVSIFARGLNNRVVTRVYFGDEDNTTDPVLSTVEPDRRSTLVAEPDGSHGYRFDIRLQGPDETVFFAL